MDGFPPTYKFIIQRILPRGRLKILDLGCGKGDAAYALNDEKQHFFTGIDIFEKYITICKKSGLYEKVLKRDLKKLSLPKNSYDVTIILQVLEHLKKADAKRLITDTEKFSRKAVIISIPNGNCKQDEYDNNPYQKHLSTWTPPELRGLGFKVYGQGLKYVYGDKTFVGRQASLFRLGLAAMSVILAPIVFFYPNMAAQLIAVKYIKP